MTTMKPTSFATIRLLLVMMVAGIALTLVSWDFKQNSGRYKAGQTDTVPRNGREKKIRDLDDALEELNAAELQLNSEKLQRELTEAMKKLDAAKIRMEFDKAMKEVDMEKIKQELNEAMKEIDGDKIKMEIDKAMKEVYGKNEAGTWGGNERYRRGQDQDGD